MKTQEQRRFTRTSIDAPVEIVDIESGVGFRAHTVNVCDGGLAFRSSLEPAMGADMHIALDGAPAAEFKVVRIAAHENGFDVAAKLS